MQSALLVCLAMTAPIWGQQKMHPSTGGKECKSCHAALLQHKTLHMPAREAMCDVCHAVPAEGGRASLTDDSEKLCLSCHDAAGFKAAFVHGPVAAGACVACHDPHGSEAPYLARAKGQALCFTCHTDMQSALTEAKFRHKALELGCTTCHSPHASPNKFQLKAAGPALCGTCHTAVVQQAANAAVKHAAASDARACLNCHDPHKANQRPQLRSDVMTLCLGCHNQPVNANGVTLANMRQVLADNPDHHGPIRDRNCAGCHQPHGSERFRLLKSEYPKEFYAPFRTENFALCFTCHDPALVRDERTTRLTDFRNGDRNLHFVHVNQSPKGRTCRACHETHASTLPSHIRTAVPFGKWQLPVNYKKAQTGGSCSPGCHVPRSYDRNQMHAAKD